MTTMVLNTKQDCRDLIEGALWMSTGGGGTMQDGLALLEKAIDEGLRLEWVDAATIPDDVWTASVCLHGSIAPVSQEALDTIDQKGLTVDESEWYVAKAVREMGAYLGHKFECLVVPELGPESLSIPLVLGAQMGIPVVDGDFVGRSVPEEVQSTYSLYENLDDMMVSTDMWGNICILKKAVNTQAKERIAKMLAVAAYGVVAVAATPLIGSDMKRVIVPGTLTKALEIGRTIRQTRETGQDPIDAPLQAIGDGWRLFDGIVERLETKDQDGYYYGNVHLKGSGNYQGQSMKVWFKNENLVSWLNGQPWVCSPDLITFVNPETGLGYYNSDINTGDQLTVIGLKGLEQFRQGKGLDITGPRYFGFDIDYVPIEELLKDGTHT